MDLREHEPGGRNTAAYSIYNERLKKRGGGWRDGGKGSSRRPKKRCRRRKNVDDDIYVRTTELFYTVENKWGYILLSGKTKKISAKTKKKKHGYPRDENVSRFVPKCTQITKFIYLRS